MSETQRSKHAHYDQLGASEAHEIVNRDDDTQLLNPPHARRRVTLRRWGWASIVDDFDKPRVINDPTSHYPTAARMSLGRKIDDVIVEAFDATAFTGETGDGAAAFDIGMVVDAQTGGGGSDVGLNAQKAIGAGRLLDAREVDPSEERFISLNAAQLASLTRTAKATGSDYQTVRALVEGKIDTFYGFKVKRHERNGADDNGADDNGADDNGADKVWFWAKSGMPLAVGADMEIDIGPRRDKNNATRIFAAMAIGATRMEETKVGHIECDPAAGPGSGNE